VLNQTCIVLNHYHKQGLKATLCKSLHKLYNIEWHGHYFELSLSEKKLWTPSHKSHNKLYIDNVLNCHHEQDLWATLGTLFTQVIKQIVQCWIIWILFQIVIMNKTFKLLHPSYKTLSHFKFYKAWVMKT